MGKPVVLVVDFGAQYAQLIARRIRECGYYSELVPASVSVSELAAYSPIAVFLSGGPASVYAPAAPKIDPQLFTLGIPVFGICYGFQLMAQALGGKVEKTAVREYGATQVSLLSRGFLTGQPQEQTVWMSHGDSVVQAPEGFEILGSSSSAIAAIWDPKRRLGGVQWHPEVKHSTYGQDTIKAFLTALAEPNWNPEQIIAQQVANIRETVGDAEVICGLSGGVDSAVAAALVHRAIGDRLHCIFVDHGLLRRGERQQVEQEYTQATGIKVYTYDASNRFGAALSGVVDPEEKRKIIGREFIRCFELAQQEVMPGLPARFLLQGTLYPDLVESGGTGVSANIKSHHNVGGLPQDLKFELLEPLKSLFKDEVRQVGLQLGLPENIVWRQPFPGPGLAIRITGEVTSAKLTILRAADAIVREELSDYERDIWQCPVVLLSQVKTVGVQGDGRTYGYPIVLRPVSSEDAMTADWSRLSYDLLAKISNRVTNEVPEVNRVVLDITSKPPGTVEWE